MNLEKVASLVKAARQNSSESQRKSRQRYRAGGQQLRRSNKLKQRRRRRQGGTGLKNRVKMQNRRLEYRPIRIRKEPITKRPRDRS